MNSDKDLTFEITNKDFDTPEKLLNYIETLKKERNRLKSEVAFLHRTLLYIVRNDSSTEENYE